MKADTVAIPIALALSLLLSSAAAAQTSLSLNQSSAGSGTGAWTTLPSCPGPASALTFDSGKQEFGCTPLPAAGSLPAGQHLGIAGSAPAIAAGTGAGKSPQVNLAASSTDSAGWIEVKTGSAPQNSATIVTVTAATPVASGDSWSCAIAPANNEAAALNNNAAPYVPMPVAGTSAFTVTSGSQKLTASTDYIWRYWCVELK